VSWERVLSGSGLAELDSYLRDGEYNDARTVVQRANAGSTTAKRAIRLFSNMLGVFCGDMVLAAPATGGVWLAGGVLAGIDYLFDKQAFLEGFHAKGRLAEQMQGIPVQWTRDAELGLRGAWLTACHNRRGRNPVMKSQPGHSVT
jgi:glucokinase